MIAAELMGSHFSALSHENPPFLFLFARFAFSAGKRWGRGDIVAISFRAAAYLIPRQRAPAQHGKFCRNNPFFLVFILTRLFEPQSAEFAHG